MPWQTIWRAATGMTMTIILHPSAASRALHWINATSDH